MKPLMRGRRLLVALYLHYFCIGLGTGMAAVTVMRNSGVIAHHSMLFCLWIAFVAGAGAVCAFHLHRHKLGWPGMHGVRRALKANLVMLMVGALVAGTLAVPALGTLYAPFIAVALMISGPMPFIMLVVNVALTHILMVYWRRDMHGLHPIELRVRSS